MIKVAIAGATGYTGGELIRILQNHPEADLRWLISTSLAGKSVSSVHRDLLGDCDLKFTEETGEPDVLFMALGHGLSREFLEKNKLPEGCKIIDLGSDFRIDNTFGNHRFVYGMSELFGEDIKNTNYVANPGCFATAITLALAPLAQESLLKDEIHIHAITGSTGAGKSLSGSSHFSYRDSNISVYKPFNHQHLGEIGKTLSAVAGDTVPQINFIPLRGDFTRGILASLYTRVSKDYSNEMLRNLYETAYIKSPFVHLSKEAVSLKEVVNTNKVLIQAERHGEYVHITSVIDNLIKGASGQAVQNMNIMFGFEENCGLRLKGSAF